MTLESHREVERKFDVRGGTPVPSLEKLPGVAAVSDPERFELDATYYDTGDLDLARAHITLRRRTGGGDAGWHLKLPIGEDEREELRLPLADDSVVPSALLERTRDVRRDRALVPVARIRTRRDVRRLLDGQGRVLAELCDDRVHGDRIVPGSKTHWREWELELVAGSLELLEQCAGLLLEAGASAPSAGSKLARVLGLAAGDVWSVRDVLARYLSTQLDELRRQEPLVRRGVPDSVHKMRVASRRARSALATYASLLEPRTVAALRDELQWVGVTLGEARDAEVLQARIEGLLAAQPRSPERAVVSRRIGAELDDRQARGRSRTVDLLDSDRYARLLDSLAVVATVEPGARAAGEVAALVLRDWKRLRRRARVAARSSAGPDRDVALHDVRKAAKRLRYAAESAVPVLGQPAVELAASCELLQDLLGEHHDSTVARELIRRVHAEVAADSGPVPVFDTLHAHEEARAEAVEQDYEVALDLLLRDDPGTWLRRSSTSDHER